MKKIESYTTNQLAKLIDYKTRQTLLQALYNNQKADKEKKDSFLSAIFKTSFKYRGKRVFNKEEIDRILK